MAVPIKPRNAPAIPQREESTPEGGLDNDGFSLYKCLARQVYGDPSIYTSVLKAVQDHFLRVWLQPQDRLYESYTQYVSQWNTNSSISTFFGSLSCPEVATDASTLTVIANALDVCIVLWEQVPMPGDPPPERFAVAGSPSFPEVHILQTAINVSNEHCSYRYDSLLEDESGHALIELMTRQKDRDDLDVKEIIWWEEDGGGDVRNYRCWNEYRNKEPRPQSEQLTNALCVFSISVSASDQIDSAISLLKDILARAPAQGTRVFHRRGRSMLPLKPYVGIDAEFKEVGLSQAQMDKAWNLSSKTEEDFEELVRGNLENLCSVLTIAVDRHVVFSFHVLHMLQNATKDTVDHLYKLFSATIFNNQMLKIWFNYQSDIRVLQATIAHVYQGTPRERQVLRDRKSGEDQWMRPTWKFSSRHLCRKRPAELTFRTHNDECRMHSKFTGVDVDGNRMGCPCYLGNVDISALLDYICRQFDWRGDDTVNNPLPPGGEWDFMQTSILPRTWTDNRGHCNYGGFLHWTIGSDPLYPLFNHLKSIPTERVKNMRIKGLELSDDEKKAEIQAWYDSLGPGMEDDDGKMGYNIGDVVGIALLMRFLTTTDDRKLLADRLSHYSFMRTLCDTQPSKPRVPSSLKPPNIHIPLFEDYPKLWKREIVGEMQLPGHRDTFALEFLRLGEVDTESLNYHEHEERAKEGEDAIVSSSKESHYAHSEVEELIKQSLLRVRERLFDPTKFSLPEIFTRDPPQQHANQDVHHKAIVRAGTPHTEDLLEKMWDYRRQDPDRKIRPPPGYMENPGTALGLPMWINRIPGLDLGIHLKAAFEDVNKPITPPSPKIRLSTGLVPFHASHRRHRPSYPASQGYDLFDPDGTQYHRALHQRQLDIRKERSNFWAAAPPSVRESSQKSTPRKSIPQQTKQPVRKYITSPAVQGYDLFDPDGTQYREAIQQQSNPQPQNPQPDKRKERSNFWAGAPPSIRESSQKSTSQQTQQTQQPIRKLPAAQGFLPRILRSPGTRVDPSGSTRAIRAASSPDHRPAPIPQQSSHGRFPSVPNYTVKKKVPQGQKQRGKRMEHDRAVMQENRELDDTEIATRASASTTSTSRGDKAKETRDDEAKKNDLRDEDKNTRKKTKENSMVRYDRPTLGKRKRVRDSEDRIDCVLERAAKTARWHSEREARIE
ncbi:MAG: hypothetical protein M1812_007162 [Candelaria pacifica]|nr:MAG: hypothetical protein M1812_007162 [Candelaria pacifica]